MSNFEEDLHRRLRRMEAPVGLADQVMQQLHRRGRLIGFPQQRAWIGSVAASLLLGALLAGGIEHHRRTDERARAERDFARSIEITDRVMEQTRQRIQRAGIALED